jgi:prephenate dehydratase
MPLPYPFGVTDPDNLRVAYLGPAGTFTEQALLTQPDLAAAEHSLHRTFPDVFFAVENDAADLAFVAIENSIEGSVNVTIDTLAFESDLLIQSEVVIPIVMNLLVKPGAALADITTVVSIPIAIAQCRGWLRNNLPDADLKAANATAEAVQLLAESADGSVAAIGTSLAADIYGLDVVAADIEDHPGNETRFVVVAPPSRGIPAPTGNDKTSMVIFQRANEPGSLLTILQEFAGRGIDLNKLESRPTKQGLGDYCFLIDCEGHIGDEVVADALRDLQWKGHRVKFMGSFPAAADRASHPSHDIAAVWAAADAWIADLRSQIKA